VQDGYTLPTIREKKTKKKKEKKQEKKKKKTSLAGLNVQALQCTFHNAYAYAKELVTLSHPTTVPFI
jgi:hypothetical protein